MTRLEKHTNICWVYGLTLRQKEVLRFIDGYSKRNGFSPSVRDIASRFGLNPATVHGHIKALERKGHLLRHPHRSRCLVVAEPETSGTNVLESQPADMTRREIPVVGRVAAGEPILASENIEEAIRLPRGWAPEGSFLLRVEGDSMQDAHILDGDYVLIRPADTASNGEIVVALIDDEATVKRFYRKNDRVELRPANAAYAPIRIVARDATALSIVGKVIGVLRI